MMVEQGENRAEEELQNRRKTEYVESRHDTINKTMQQKPIILHNSCTYLQDDSYDDGNGSGSDVKHETR